MKNRFISLFTLFLLVITVFTGCTNTSSEDINTTSTVLSTIETEFTTTIVETIVDTSAETTTTSTPISETSISESEDIINFVVNDSNSKILLFNHNRSVSPNDLTISSVCEYLNYYNFDISPSEFFSYVPASPVLGPNEVPDLNEQFAGNSYEEFNFGCFAPVIETSIYNYFVDSKPENLTLSNITGINCNDLYAYIDKGVPVLVWVSSNMQDDIFSLETLNGSITTSSTLCVSTLVGYSDTSVYLTSYRETNAYTEYSKEDFEKIFVALGSQAIVIEETN